MWEALQVSTGDVHVVPIADATFHIADRYCLCLPSRRFEHHDGLFNRGGWVVTHNSYDGREAGEEGHDVDGRDTPIEYFEAKL
jgi:hypothetical protein